MLASTSSPVVTSGSGRTLPAKRHSSQTSAAYERAALYEPVDEQRDEHDNHCSDEVGQHLGDRRKRNGRGGAGDPSRPWPKCETPSLAASCGCVEIPLSATRKGAALSLGCLDA